MPNGTIYTYVGNADPKNGTGVIETSQGTVVLGGWGYFLPNEYQSAIGQGLILVPGQSGAAPSPARGSIPLDLASAPQALSLNPSPGSGVTGASASDHIHPMPSSNQLADVTPGDTLGVGQGWVMGSSGLLIPETISAYPPLYTGSSNGQMTLPRGHKDDSGSFTATPVSQVLHLTYFMASAAQSVGHIKFGTGGTAASGNTLTQTALFSVNPSTGALTGLLANSASPGSALTATFAQISHAMVTPFILVPGTIYAVGLLQVGTTSGSLLGGWDNDEFLSIQPILCATSAGHATMPSTVSSVSATAFAVGYFLTT